MARIFAKGLNCTNPNDGAPCGECDFCRGTADGSLVDVIEIDAASNRGIGEIRDLREKVNFMPNRANRKIYIIDEVHMLTNEAFNALLKTLEEPPSHAFFLLATTELHKIPETIISRCQTFTFGRFTVEKLIERLRKICDEEKFSADEESLKMIARKAEGGLRDAIGLLEQTAAETEHKLTAENVRASLGVSSTEMLENFWDAIDQSEAENAFEILQEISRSGGDFRTFGHDFLGFLREKMHTELRAKSSVGKIVSVIEEIEIALGRLKSSPIVELPLEIAVVKLCHGKPTGNFSEQKIAPKKVVAPPEPKSVEKSPEILEKKILPTETEKKVEKTSPAPLDETSGFLFDGVPAPKPAPKPAAAAPQTPMPTSGELTVPVVRERMEEMAKKSGIPVFVKKSFLSSCTPEISNEKILFRSDSNFHLNQLNNSEIKNKLSGCTEEIFGKKWLVDFTHASTITQTEEKTEEVATADDFLKF